MHQQDPRTRNRGKKRKAAEDMSDDSEKMDDNIFEPGKRTEVIVVEIVIVYGSKSLNGPISVLKRKLGGKFF